MPFLVSLTWQTLIDAEPMSTPTRFFPSPMAVLPSFRLGAEISRSQMFAPRCADSQKTRLLPAESGCSKRLATSRWSAAEIRSPKDNGVDVSHVLILRAKFTTEPYQSSLKISV